jgi:hypothetical protein
VCQRCTLGRNFNWATLEFRIILVGRRGHGYYIWTFLLSRSKSTRRHRLTAACRAFWFVVLDFRTLPRRPLLFRALHWTLNSYMSMTLSTRSSSQ